MTYLQELIATLRFAAAVYAELAERVDPVTDDLNLRTASERRRHLADALERTSGEPAPETPSIERTLGDWRQGTSADGLIAAIEREAFRLAELVYFADGSDASREIIEQAVDGMEALLLKLEPGVEPALGPDDQAEDFAGGESSGTGDADADGSRGCEVPERELFPVWFATDRAPLEPSKPSSGFSGRRSQDGVRQGRCLVHVPLSHRLGSLGSDLLHRIRHGDDRLRVHSRETFAAADFWNRVDAAVTDEQRGRHAVVFIHGYNVSFDEAATRAAQLGFDLGVRGPMSFFSWPSRGRAIGYIADGNSIDASAGAITKFLVSMATLPRIETVHVIAHSMGNRGALSAVTAIAEKAERLSGRRFGQFVLAAADVDAQVFRQRAAAYRDVGTGTTLYVSPNDRALALSEILSAFPRAGRVPPVNVVDGINTIDVGDINLSSLGHGYVGEAVGVLRDMHDLITTARKPDDRFGLKKRHDDAGAIYWAFRP